MRSTIFKLFALLIVCVATSHFVYGQNEMRLFENKVLDEMDNNLKTVKKLGTFAVKGLSEKDLSKFPLYIIDQITIQPTIEKHKDEKILVQFWSLYGYDSPLKGIMTCSIEFEFERKHDSYFPDKEVVLPLITKQCEEQMNKLLSLRKQPLHESKKKLHTEIARETAQIAELNAVISTLSQKAGDFSRQTAEDLKAKLWIQDLEMQNQIVGNKTMIQRLENKIKGLPTLRHAITTISESSVLIENANRSKHEYDVMLSDIRSGKAANDPVREREINKNLNLLKREIRDQENKILELFPDHAKQVTELENKIRQLEKVGEEGNISEESRNRLELLGKDLNAARGNVLKQGIEFIRATKEDLSLLPSLQLKLSETRIATDVLETKHEQILSVRKKINEMMGSFPELERSRNQIIQHQNMLELLNKKLLDLQMSQLEDQSFELVPLK